MLPTEEYWNDSAALASMASYLQLFAAHDDATAARYAEPYLARGRPVPAVIRAALIRRALEAGWTDDELDEEDRRENDRWEYADICYDEERIARLGR